MTMTIDQNERLARRLAGEKLSGTDLVLCRGIGFRDSAGWRFAARPASSPDWLFTGREMAVMVRVFMAEVKAGKVLMRD